MNKLLLSETDVCDVAKVVLANGFDFEANWFRFYSGS